MEDASRNPLVVSEISGLWNTYTNDCMAVCVFKHFLNNVDDAETRTMIQDALKLSEQHINELEGIFNKENIPIPAAFGEADVNISAPRLFSDPFYLFYLSHMSSFGMDGYSLITRYVARPDIREFFLRCLNDATGLYRKAIDIRLAKGIFIKAPRVEVSKKVTFIEKESFLAGIMGGPRALLAREVTNAFSGILVTTLWRAMLAGFGQCASSPEVKDFMFKGRDLATKHFQGFSKVLNQENIPSPSDYDSFITDSTIPPFSERLMMYHIFELCAFSMGVNGFAIASSMRSDLTSMHSQYGVETAKYGSEGLDIMINNKWMEQPPQVIRHENLATV